VRFFFKHRTTGVNSLVLFSKGQDPRKNYAMSTTPPFINIPGASGTLYPYWKLDTPRVASSIMSVAGNYVFLKQLPDGKYLPVYIGQADDLSKRLPNHERFDDAVKAGASLVVTHSTPAGELPRLAEERDLIAKWNPPLNVHHRTTG
jgi:hypothetical protein